MKRVATGIKGFDKLIEGGFPENTTLLLAGSPGTGKSIFSLEYIYRGAKDYGETGMYVSFEQNAHDLKEQALQIGFNDLEKLEKEGKIFFFCIPVHSINKDTLEHLFSNAKTLQIKRIVIDSLSALAINAPIFSAMGDLVVRDVLSNASQFSPSMLGENFKKSFIYKFISRIKEIPATTLLLSEVPEHSSTISSDSVSEFATDGVIQLTFESMGGAFSRSLLVRKMRKTKNNEDIHPLEISPEGIKIHSL